MEEEEKKEADRGGGGGSHFCLARFVCSFGRVLPSQERERVFWVVGRPISHFLWEGCRPLFFRGRFLPRQHCEVLFCFSLPLCGLFLL